LSYGDAITRIGQIQAQLSALQSGVLPGAASASPSGATAGAAGAAGSLGVTYGTNQLASAGTISGTSFASLLAQAQGTSFTGPAGSASLSSRAASMLTPGQQQFVSRLATDTGLSVQVIAAWVLAEESGSAAASRQSAGNHDWLNIGYTDAGTYGASDSVWSDPITAADATAGWLKGQNTIPGYGTAGSGIHAILQAAGQPPAAQVAAIQRSGWASSGYPDLPGLLAQVGSS
jgi:hypothetical protein